MNALRARVNALRRKMARELTVVRLRRLSDEFSLQCAVAVGDRQPQPEPHAFIGRVVDAGFRLPTFMAVHKYLDRCRRRNAIPEIDGLLRTLLPWAAARGYIGAFF